MNNIITTEQEIDRAVDSIFTSYFKSSSGSRPEYILYYPQYNYPTSVWISDSSIGSQVASRLKEMLSYIHYTNVTYNEIAVNEDGIVTECQFNIYR